MISNIRKHLYQNTVSSKETQTTWTGELHPGMGCWEGRRKALEEGCGVKDVFKTQYRETDKHSTVQTLTKTHACTNSHTGRRRSIHLPSSMRRATVILSRT